MKNQQISKKIIGKAIYDALIGGNWIQTEESDISGRNCLRKKFIRTEVNFVSGCLACHRNHTVFLGDMVSPGILDGRQRITCRINKVSSAVA